MEEFEEMRSIGGKITVSLLLQLAIDIVHNANEGCTHHRSTCHISKPTKEAINIIWTQIFMLKHRIFRLSQSGELMISPQKREWLEKEIEFHLGCVKRGFGSGELNENLIEKSDETQLVINMDNSKTLDYIGDEPISYVDVASGGDPMTLMVRLTGGPRAAIKSLFLICKSTAIYYRIRGFPDSIPGVSYISSPKAWAGSKVWSEWLSEPRSMPAQLGDRKRTLFLDYCSSEIEDESIQEHLSMIKVMLRNFLANTTESTQPSNSFIIQKIKDRCRFHWENYNFNKIK